MKFWAVIIAVLTGCASIFGQDGSDLNYVRPDELDNSFIGRRLHLDFYTRSFSSAFSGDKRVVDTVSIEVRGRKVEFIEHRSDDGFNNWFSGQFLESVKEVDGRTLRVKEFELLEIRKDDILVKGFFVFVNKDGRARRKGSFSHELLFARKDIVEWLFKAKD